MTDQQTLLWGDSLHTIYHSLPISSRHHIADYGIQRPWYFFFTNAYWFDRQKNALARRVDTEEQTKYNRFSTDDMDIDNIDVSMFCCSVREVPHHETPNEIAHVIVVFN